MVYQPIRHTLSVRFRQPGVAGKRQILVARAGQLLGLIAEDLSGLRIRLLDAPVEIGQEHAGVGAVKREAELLLA